MGFGRKTNAFNQHPEEPARELCAGTITRVAQQKRDPERVSVFIDDEFAFGLTLDLAAREGLKKGMSLSIEAQQALLNEEKDFRARAVALNYVGYQARTVEEVRRKLRKKGYSADIIDDVIPILSEIRGARLTRQGISGFKEFYVEEDADGARRRFRLEGEMIFRDQDEEIDCIALEKGWISVTPLGLSLFDAQSFSELGAWKFFGKRKT